MTAPKIAYELITHQKEFFKNQWSIRILEGTYANVVFQYDAIKVVEPFPHDGDSEITLEYETIIVDNPYGPDIIKEKEFEVLVSEILNAEVIKWIEATIEQQEIDQNENRKSDTEESDSR